MKELTPELLAFIEEAAGREIVVLEDVEEMKPLSPGQRQRLQVAWDLQQWLDEQRQEAAK